MGSNGTKLGKMSLTEMLRSVDSDDIERFRNEDHIRDTRLTYLNDKIGLPFDKPAKFEATDVRDRAKVWLDFYEPRKDNYCAFRCVPKEGNKDVKIRLRGRTIKQTLDWFDNQDIDYSKYYLYVMPHKLVKAWSTIFVVNEWGITGEIIYGEHSQLTQGFHESERPIVFHYDFKEWTLDPENDAAKAYLIELIKYIKVDKKHHDEISKKQNVSFVNDYMAGYYETVQDGETDKTTFIDFSTVLGEKYKDFRPSTSDDSDGPDVLVSGQTGCRGKVTANVRVVKHHDDDFEEGEILVAEMTTPDYLPMMQKAAAIITDEGGILAHAAIVAREMDIPCITGTQDATATLKNGQKVKVDANHGVVLELK